MENQFQNVMNGPNASTYDPDAFITFSDHIFDILNSVKKKKNRDKP